MSKIIRLTESDLTRIVKRVISENSEHVKNLYISWANKKSGDPENALKIMDDVFKFQKKLPKKDFSQYSSYVELKTDLDKLKKSQLSEDATKIYEDTDLLVLAANTWEASCKYGAGTKWCTTARDDSSYWDRHNQSGTEFFWIFKNKPQRDPNHKFSYHIKKHSSDDWCNSVNSCMTSDRLPENSYPKQHPKYKEIISKLHEFHNSRNPDSVRTVSYKNDNQEYLYRFIYSNILSILGGLDLQSLLKNTFYAVLDNYLINHILYDLETASIDAYEIEEDLEDKWIPEIEKHLEKLIKESGGLKQIFLDDQLEGISRMLSYPLEEIVSEKINITQPIQTQLQQQNINLGKLFGQIKKEQVEEILYEDFSTEMFGWISDNVIEYFLGNLN
jgi:hypothetical protein